MSSRITGHFTKPTDLDLEILENAIKLPSSIGVGKKLRAPSGIRQYGVSAAIRANPRARCRTRFHRRRERDIGVESTILDRWNERNESSRYNYRWHIIQIEACDKMVARPDFRIARNPVSRTNVARINASMSAHAYALRFSLSLGVLQIVFAIRWHRQKCKRQTKKKFI